MSGDALRLSEDGGGATRPGGPPQRGQRPLERLVVGEQRELVDCRRQPARPLGVVGHLGRRDHVGARRRIIRQGGLRDGPQAAKIALEDTRFSPATSTVVLLEQLAGPRQLAASEGDTQQRSRRHAELEGRDLGECGLHRGDRLMPQAERVPHASQHELRPALEEALRRVLGGLDRLACRVGRLAQPAQRGQRDGDVPGQRGHPAWLVARRELQRRAQQRERLDRPAEFAERAGAGVEGGDELAVRTAAFRRFGGFAGDSLRFARLMTLVEREREHAGDECPQRVVVVVKFGVQLPQRSEQFGGSAHVPQRP